MHLKRYLSITLLVITFFSGCEFSFKSRADKPSPTKTYLFAQACDLNESKAKETALKSLRNKSSIPTISEFSSLHLKKDDKKFCYEASVSAEEWAIYSNDLAKRRQAIIQVEKDQNGTRFYSKKGEWINGLLISRSSFNNELDHAHKIAPIKSLPFDLNFTQFTKTLNTKPSIKMDYTPCKKRSNYNCQIGFVSKVGDEDKTLTYYWDFGDESTSTHKNPLYTYNREGDYNVTLMVTDSFGANSSVSSVLKVMKSRKPFAKFTTKKRVYKTGDNIIFINRSYTQVSKIKAYYWNFGDGKKSTKRNPKHTYHRTGKYVVSLKVCNKNKYCSVASKRFEIKKGKALIDAKQGVKIEVYMSENGAPSQQIVKSKALMSAYKYGNIWLLCKRGKIECAIKEEGLETNLLGQPKKCYWHEKHAKEYMVELE